MLGGVRAPSDPDTPARAPESAIGSIGLSEPALAAALV